MINAGMINDVATWAILIQFVIRWLVSSYFLRNAGFVSPVKIDWVKRYDPIEKRFIIGQKDIEDESLEKSDCMQPSW